MIACFQSRPIFSFGSWQQMNGDAPRWVKRVCSDARCVLLIATMAAAGDAMANQTVYLCKGVYADQSCKDGSEVDILPTESADRLSGLRQRNAEARDRDNSRLIGQSINKGFASADKSMRCEALIRERQAIDRSTGSAERRFQIRQEQFALKCPKQ